MAASEVLSTFERRVARLQVVKADAEKARASGHLKLRDVDHIYESTMLGVVTAFEGLLEELFFVCALGKSGQTHVRPRAEFRHRADAERVVLAEASRGFVDWLPIPATLERAEAYLVGGRPFSLLRARGQDKGLLKEVVTVRNAIAHRGGAARDRFRALSPIATLPTVRQTPAGLLSSSVGPLKRHEHYLNEVLRISYALCSRSAHRAEAYLGPETVMNSGQQPGRGTYECQACSATHRLYTDAARLPPCPSCHSGPCLHCGHASKSRYLRVRR